MIARSKTFSHPTTRLVECQAKLKPQTPVTLKRSPSGLESPGGKRPDFFAVETLSI